MPLADSPLSPAVSTTSRATPGRGALVNASCSSFLSASSRRFSLAWVFAVIALAAVCTA